MSDKTLIGRVQQVQTKYGELVKISLGPNDLKLATNGWINMVLKTGKSGKMYLELDTWVPEKKMSAAKDVGDVFNTLSDMTSPIGEDDGTLPF